MNNQAHYYALQVKTRGELKFIQQVRAQNPGCPLSLYFPRRSLDIRKGGKITPSQRAVFPGYVFLELESCQMARNYLWVFRKTEGFYRFLKSNRDITPLKQKDLEVVLHFIKTVGPVAGKSSVYFDEKSRIVVMEGPLSGLEGSIVKVDRRKKRAKIKLDLYGDSFLIDFAFTVLEKPEDFKANFVKVHSGQSENK